jgi:hypothetical protein
MTKPKPTMENAVPTSHTAQWIRRSIVTLASLALFALAAIACASDPGGPEAFRAAVAKGDAAAVYGMLDAPTRGRIEKVRKAHREALGLIRDLYPPEIQDNEARRFIDAETGPEFLASYEKRYQPFERMRPHLANLDPNQFVAGKYTGMDKPWQDIERRYEHMLKIVRENATAVASLR